jgi:hypothetical protein
VLLFAHADRHVRRSAASLYVLRTVLHLVERSVRASARAPLSAEGLVALLRAVKQLSMDPEVLDALQQAGAVDTLVRLADRAETEHVATLDPVLYRTVQNNAVFALYYLTKINRMRQEAAAVAGVLPHLTRIITEKHPLAQFAIPMACDLAHASRRAQVELSRGNAIALYLSILADPDLRTDGVEDRACLFARTWVEENWKERSKAKRKRRTGRRKGTKVQGRSRRR